MGSTIKRKKVRKYVITTTTYPQKIDQLFDIPEDDDLMACLGLYM
jgi:hypothetical protein